MKTLKFEKLTVSALLLVIVCSKASIAQEKPVKRDLKPQEKVMIADSYDAEFYYLYNKQSSKGRVGGTTANYDGPLFYSNSAYDIHFAPRVGSNFYDYYFTMSKGRNGDPLFYSPKNNWVRFGGNAGLAFWGDGKYSQNDLPNLFIDHFGKVGIGNILDDISTSNQNSYSLFVSNGVLSEKYGLGSQYSWADHVLKEDYSLKALSDVEEFIIKNGHLPNIPTAEEIAKDGYSIHDMNVKFLEKIEELTLHLIEQDKEIKQLRQELDTHVKDAK
ncbi:hypothetical protein [Sphingobacterium haloxyli]|uniref:Peptidase S74 domain-containing protein n=1 Tax=Sphingobacterium haloxyli TaxID=2100533 RepID=A0A2S9J4Q8_9SPHI|nr:hypothetical protein [Sphingobacterium haloxyli]PRD47778.1 hypothetical protein C5745_07630 [Sphingobacterium haloxyli]